MEKGVVVYDFATYKGFRTLNTSQSASRNEQVGDYTLQAFFSPSADGVISKNAKPLFYIATINGSGFVNGFGGNEWSPHLQRKDYLIFPHGLQDFKDNIDTYTASAALMHRFGANTELSLDVLKMLDGDILGALGEQWKSTLKDPTFYLGLTLSFGSLKLSASNNMHITNRTQRIGVDFEQYLNRKLGSSGAFSVGGREFDGSHGNIWYEAKGGDFWTNTAAKNVNKWKSTIGHKNKIAKDNNRIFHIYSEERIPEVFKDYMNKSNIPYFENLKEGNFYNTYIINNIDSLFNKNKY